MFSLTVPESRCCNKKDLIVINTILLYLRFDF